MVGWQGRVAEDKRRLAATTFDICFAMCRPCRLFPPMQAHGRFVIELMSLRLATKDVPTSSTGPRRSLNFEKRPAECYVKTYGDFNIDVVDLTSGIEQSEDLRNPRRLPRILVTRFPDRRSDFHSGTRWRRQRLNCSMSIGSTFRSQCSSLVLVAREM